MTVLHLGLIGCGRWGQYILRDLKLMGCEVTVVCRSQESIQRAQTHQANRVVSDWQQLPTHLHGIVIASLASTHFQMIKNVSQRNIPILVEKPMALTEAEGKELLLMNSELFVMSKFRYHNGVQKMKDIFVSQTLGRPLGLKTKCYRWSTDHDDIDFLTVLVPHELSITYEILGVIPPLHWASLHCWENNKNYLNVLMKDDWLWAHYDIDSCAHQPMREIKLICEKGIAVLNGISSDQISILPALNKNTLTETDVEIVNFSSNQCLFEELKAFIEYLSGGAEPKTSAKQAYDQMRILEEIKRQCIMF